MLISDAAAFATSASAICRVAWNISCGLFVFRLSWAIDGEVMYLPSTMMVGTDSTL
jgi:hypothetical protein